MEHDAVVRNTFSLCPVCLKKISAKLTQKKGQEIYLRKVCPEHGAFAVPVWKGHFDFAEWNRMEVPMTGEEAAACSGNCRTCNAHGQDTCCVILEVTKACNLRCPYCFAYGGETAKMPPVEDLKRDIRKIVELAGAPLLQLSGGEPTLRDDLPELAAYAKEAGCAYTQINTNGIRLAEDEAYVRSLAEAGLDIVFLQFDGTEDDIYKKLRGRVLAETKIRAIQNCAKYHIGVTLVPTIVRGINDDRVGTIIKTALALFPAVRGVHFQPVAYLGRYPEQTTGTNRYTLDELMQNLIDQTGIPSNTLLPSRCDHASCEFHATFIVSDDRHLIPVSDRAADTRAGRTSAGKNRQYVAEHWKSADHGSSREHDLQTMKDADMINIKSAGDFAEKPILFGRTDGLDFDTFIRYMRSRVLKISAMAFQDAMNLDLERLGRCSLHVYENEKLLPFCGKYLTSI